MARAPHNSTLIEADNGDGYMSILPSPHEMMNRYSPILPPKIADKINVSNKNNNANSDNNYCYNKYKTHSMASKQGTTAQQRRHKNVTPKQCSNEHRRQIRSISLRSADSGEESSGKEIVIWIEDEPRYVSGVTKKTSCNDIITALIDDEIRNGNGNFVGTKCVRDGAASRDCGDYVIAESWCGIERSYNGNMAILPVWNAWTRVQTELRLILRHRKDIRLSSIQKSKIENVFSSIFKYFCRFLKLSQKHKSHSTHFTNLKDSKPDEYVSIVLLNKLYHVDASIIHQARANQQPIQSTDSNELKETKIQKQKLYALAEPAKFTKRRSRHIRKKHQDKIHDNSVECIRRRKDTLVRQSIRQKLAKKTREINELYEREYLLTKVFLNKCKLHKLQNELYTNPEIQLEISIGQIQHNVETYAREIIETEHELLELKNEIKRDISIINRLKRLTLSAPNMKAQCPPDITTRTRHFAQVAKTETKTEMETPIEFVDNIYEFCDNNASMLV